MNDQERQEIDSHSRQWVNNNLSMKCTGDGYYSSPRLSSEYLDCSMPLTFDSYSFCSMGCRYCIPAGTQIGAIGKRKDIEELVVGDKVLSYDIKNKCIELDEVTKVMSRQVDEIYEIVLENGKKLKITGEHPVYIKDKGWVAVKDLKETDDILYWKRPGTAYAEFRHNPMKNPLIAKKVGDAQRGRPSAMTDTQKENIRLANKTRIHTEKERNNASNRMKVHNPMDSKAVVAKTQKHLAELRASGKLVPPWLGKKRPDIAKLMKTDINPMKNPEIYKLTIGKARKTLAKQGGVSKGQLKLRNYLTDLDLTFEEEFEIPSEKSRYYLDFYLPDFHVCIEYDGHLRHYYTGKEKDTIRDKYLLSKYGIKTLRIDRDLVFVEKKTKELIEEYIDKCALKA